ncbi:hypothetical protein YQE_07316, partial [Dendroctonus ponderosae]
MNTLPKIPVNFLVIFYIMCFEAVVSNSRTSTLWTLNKDRTRVIPGEPDQIGCSARPGDSLFALVASTQRYGGAWVRRSPHCQARHNQSPPEHELDCGKPANATFYDSLAGVMDRGKHPPLVEPEAIGEFVKKYKLNMGKTVDLELVESKLRQAKKEGAQQVVVAAPQGDAQLELCQLALVGQLAVAEGGVAALVVVGVGGPQARLGGGAVAMAENHVHLHQGVVAMALEGVPPCCCQESEQQLADKSHVAPATSSDQLESINQSRGRWQRGTSWAIFGAPRATRAEPSSASAKVLASIHAQFCFNWGFAALSVAPHHPEVLLSLAKVLFRLQYLDDAIFLTRRSLEVVPPEKGAWQQYFTLGLRPLPGGGGALPAHAGLAARLRAGAEAAQRAGGNAALALAELHVVVVLLFLNNLERPAPNGCSRAQRPQKSLWSGRRHKKPAPT